MNPIIHKISSKFFDLYTRIYLYLLKYNKKVEFSNLRLIGIPILDARNGGNIILGENVLLNSRNIGHHINLNNPVKLFVDKPNAIIEIGNDTRIHGSCIHAFMRISIGKKCLIAGNCQIIGANGHQLSFNNVGNRNATIDSGNPIIIEDSVWIGANSIILPGVKIGYGSVIGAGSVVTTTIPSMVLATGNPARVIRSYDGHKIDADAIKSGELL